MKKYRYLISMSLIAIVMSGCALWQKNYGKLKSLPKGESQVAIRDLIDKWEDFDIYYASSGTPFSFGIMFDPKENDTALVGDMWKKIADKETLIETVKRIEHDRLLKEILGPDGRFYGYIYYSYGHITLKMMGDKKMYVFGLEPKIGN